MGNSQRPANRRARRLGEETKECGVSFGRAAQAGAMEWCALSGLPFALPREPRQRYPQQLPWRASRVLATPSPRAAP